jgi:tRNA-specific 2-thiouridylase
MSPDVSRIFVALSGGVDSAVAAWLLRERGHAVECLHMSNWDDSDGYCGAATDLQDARQVCERLALPLHRVNFTREYRESVFADFLRETQAGRTPNPDVLCNREIKFGLLRRYARRLGASVLATGHYARLGREQGLSTLLKAKYTDKDQSYFLSAVASADFADVDFPLGGLRKSEVRRLAEAAGLGVATKRDSTGICFIGERPFASFLAQFIEPCPGPIITADGAAIGEHDGLHCYTLGQRKGIGIGGLEVSTGAPWYVADKRVESNELVVVQGHDHPLLFSDWLEAEPIHWIGPIPQAWVAGEELRCRVKTRYRQADQACTLVQTMPGRSRVLFGRPQRAVTPGQYAVFYLGERCLGSARIERTGRGASETRDTAKAC